MRSPRRWCMTAPRILAATAVGADKARLLCAAPAHATRRPGRSKLTNGGRSRRRNRFEWPIQSRDGDARRRLRQEDYDQEQEEEQEDESGQIERRGDRPTVSGSRAVLRNGVAYAPSRAPQSVKNAIWAANTPSPQTVCLGRRTWIVLRSRLRLFGNGFLCAPWRGRAQFAAAFERADALRRTRPRAAGSRFIPGPGHTFAVIAGLRLDTTDLGRGGDVGPRWYAYGRDTGGYVARHPAGNVRRTAEFAISDSRG